MEIHDTLNQYLPNNAMPLLYGEVLRPFHSKAIMGIHLNCSNDFLHFHRRKMALNIYTNDDFDNTFVSYEWFTFLDMLKEGHPKANDIILMEPLIEDEIIKSIYSLMLNSISYNTLYFLRTEFKKQINNQNSEYNLRDLIVRLLEFKYLIDYDDSYFQPIEKLRSLYKDSFLKPLQCDSQLVPMINIFEAESYLYYKTLKTIEEALWDPSLQPCSHGEFELMDKKIQTLRLSLL